MRESLDGSVRESLDGSVRELLDGSVRDLAAAVNGGAVDPAEIVRAAAARIEALDPGIGAVVRLDPDRALRRLRAGRRVTGPLAGLPYLVKDLHAEVDGLPLARGSRLFAGLDPAGTSTMVARLEAAGALVIGRTSSPEFGLNITTEPVLYGPTRNPWNRQRSPGGSSGGAAAAVAAGMVPAAHASDSGGSIRIPAAWCGLVGFKPTRGRNPAGPYRVDDWSGLSHEHAITRTVADSALLLSVTSGPAIGEPYPAPADHTRPRPSTIGVLVDTPSGDPVAPAYLLAVRECAAALAALGHRVVPLPAVEAAGRIGPVLGAVIAGHLAATVDDLARTTGRQAGPDTVEPAVLDLIERGRRADATSQVRATLELRRLAGELAGALATVDLVLSPTTARPAPPLGTLHTDRTATELFREIFTISPFVGMFNVTGGPALSLPWGLDDDAMPIGLQLAGHPGCDQLVLEVAAALEEAQPDRVRLRRDGRRGDDGAGVRPAVDPLDAR
ncbi:amidase [Solwaraspora sp. WMMD406]|uniref:amidase n=1 Tax=Solwaraspora sp. WMMD406 TaxID=3016095 RepID=UPI002417FB1D|nr:amidase [Solwaraspora sp. WMMD406]MDG4768096.1 amidase [Solwaraspora sp. WMMD406]